MKIFRFISKTWVMRLGIGCVLSILLSSCLKTTYNPVIETPAALVTFVQASPDQPPLDLFFDNNKVNFYTLTYGNVINYFRAYKGKRNVHFYAQGTMNQIYGDTINLTPNKFYSLFLANKPGHEEIVLMTDSITQPAYGKAGIRFVNMSPDSPPVSLSIQNSQAIATNVPYKGASSFVPIQGNSNYTVEVRQGTTNTVLTTTSFNVIAGSVYTVWFHGLTASAAPADKLNTDIYTNAFFYY
ncbi:MAG: DUF4397 domain-containing protein [Mucilaginibacter sp.]